MGYVPVHQVNPDKGGDISPERLKSRKLFQRLAVPHSHGTAVSTFTNILQVIFKSYFESVSRMCRDSCA